MKLTFKFFQWRIKVATEKLGEEEKAKFLANELVKAVQNSGRSIQLSRIAEGYGSMEINYHHYGTGEAVLCIGNLLNGWQISTKPTFKLGGKK